MNASDFECIICREILYRPVTMTCGHSFCEHEIKNLETCPICREVLCLKDCKVNVVMNDIIQRLFPEETKSRSEIVNEIEKCKLFCKKYFESRRYKILKLIINKTLMKHGLATFTDLIENASQLKITTFEEELIIVLTKLDDNFIMKIDGISFAVSKELCCDTSYIQHVYKFIVKQQLSNNEVLKNKIIAVVSAATERMRLNFTIEGELNRGVDTSFVEDIYRDYLVNESCTQEMIYDTCKDLELNIEEAPLPTNAVFGNALGVIGSYETTVPRISFTGLRSSDLNTMMTTLNQFFNGESLE